MIPNQLIEITISNQGKYFSSLGYSGLKQGDVIEVDWKILPKNSNKCVKVVCDECRIVFERSIQMLNRRVTHHCYSCARKHVSKINSIKQKGKKRPHVSGKKHPRWNPDKDNFQRYKADVARVTGLQDLSLLENYDKLRGLCGVKGAYQLDHILSVKYGYENNISPEVIGHISNLQFIPWEENRAKWDKVIQEERKCH